MVIKKLISKYKKKWYTFEIPFSDVEKYNVKYLIADFSGSKRIDRKYSTSEDGKKFQFALKTTEKSKEEIEKLSKMLMEEDNIPKYTFKCYQCKTVFILAELGQKWVLHKDREGKLTSKLLCSSCSRN